MDDATRHWLRQKAQDELGGAQSDLVRIEEDLDRWRWRQLDFAWQHGIYDPDERIGHFSDQRHDARSKVRFLRAVVRGLDGEIGGSK